MVHVRVKRGLQIPISGAKATSSQEEIVPRLFSLDLRPFKGVNFRILVQEGQSLQRHEPVVEIKENPEVRFVIPVSGVVKEIRRGEKRRLLEIIFERGREGKDGHELLKPHPAMSRDEIVKSLSQSGLITRFFHRPFERPVTNGALHPPRSCFVRAVDLRLFSPSMEEALAGLEGFFKKGLELVSVLCANSPVHVVTYKDSSLSKWIPQENGRCIHHTVEGVYPACSSSVHIHEIDPINSPQDSVWTIDAVDVCRIGFFSETGSLDMPILISRAGDGFQANKRQYIRTREGASIQELVQGALEDLSEDSVRLISGDPLNGAHVTLNGFLQRGHSILSAIPEQDESQREFLHFFRLGSNKYTASGAYLSGHMDVTKRTWHFTTNIHGEQRAFVDGSLYEKVVPMDIFPMQIVKALLAEDYERAINYGLLDVSREDFALPEFVCPCKIPMMKIVEDGLDRCRIDLIGN